MYDVIGIGIGPSNLGLAALLEDIPEISALFFDEKETFSWHPGLLMEETTLQVSFLADLVTMANPKSEFTFMNYLHETGRLYLFFSLNEFTIPRLEYNKYLSWAASKLPSCRFNSRVINVTDDSEGYTVTVWDGHKQEERQYRTKHLVMATGAEPALPMEIKENWKSSIFPAVSYLHNRDRI